MGERDLGLGLATGRRGFLAGAVALGAAAASGASAKPAGGKVIAGFDEVNVGKLDPTPWKPFSDRKVRVGIAGEGVCSFGSSFGFQNHPNVEVVACTDLIPENRRRLQERVKAPRAYESCEEMIEKEKGLEAVYIATDAPSHVRLAILALRRGLHVCSAVPALLGKEQLEFIPDLLEAVKTSGKVYQMNETTAFRPQCFEMRNVFEAGGFGELAYTEGEYWHYTAPGAPGVGSFKGWRQGLPPQYYPTHSNGFYTCVTHRRFTEVTCIGKPSDRPLYTPKGNRYGNPYASEVAFFKCEDGSAARMGVFWDMPGMGGEVGRCWGRKGNYRNDRYVGDNALVAGVARCKPQLPPGMPAGAHGGSHGYLTDDFIRAILLNRKPCVDVVTALNTTVSGIYAHLSAMKGGETLKIPVFGMGLSG